MVTTVYRATVMASLVLVAACAAKQPAVQTSSAPPPPSAGGPVSGDPSGSVDDALEQLAVGNSAAARQTLLSILKARPGDRKARSLLDQIETNPQVLLGAKSYAYKVQPGDTMSILAKRLLGDSEKFYALARYNGIDDPRRIAVGQVLRIPGAPKPVRAATPAPARMAPEPVANPQNPARARALRGTALAEMNKGNINRAVALLQQASRMDPGNGAIKADLDRALRVQGTVGR